MSGGVIVVAGVVGALALFETVLSRAFAALWRWRREQTKAREEEKNADDFAVRNVGEMACGHDGPSGLRHNAISPRLSPSADNAKSAYRERDPRSNEAGANRLWEEARGMAHRFLPDWEKDQDYLAKIYAAARLGHLEAMAKLGEYAGRRGAVVEAYYWTLLADLKGVAGLKVQLRELRSRWQALGCPEQYSNAYGDFTEEQGVFARAVLRLQCGVDPQYARARLRELAERGLEEARLFLKVR